VRIGPWTGALGAVALLVAAQGLRREVAAGRARWPRTVEAPYAPSPAAAPYLTLGYRELAADLLWIRTRIYFGGDDDTADGLRALVDATVALDPMLVSAYEYGARAIQWVDGGHDLDDLVWSVGLLERGIRQVPDRWRLPYLAGQIYLLDLESDDEAQQAAWRERGLVLLERAVRMPGAPRNLATLIAHHRTELGQLERAARDLEELIRITDDAATRRKLIDKLAALRDDSAARIADEEQWMRERLQAAWQAALPEAPLEMYLLLGDPPRPYLELGDLAMDRELVGAAADEGFEPVGD
jgi:hypothetical protein